MVSPKREESEINEIKIVDQIRSLGIDMIKNAKIGVAIAGSYEEVKNEATYVTKNSAKDRRLFRSSI